MLRDGHMAIANGQNQEILSNRYLIAFSNRCPNSPGYLGIELLEEVFQHRKGPRIFRVIDSRITRPGIQLVELQKPRQMIPVGMRNKYLVDLPALLKERGYHTVSRIKEYPPFFYKIPNIYSFFVAFAPL